MHVLVLVQDSRHHVRGWSLRTIGVSWHCYPSASGRPDAKFHIGFPLVAIDLLAATELWNQIFDDSFTGVERVAVVGGNLKLIFRLTSFFRLLLGRPPQESSWANFRWLSVKQILCRFLDVQVLSHCTYGVPLNAGFAVKLVHFDNYWKVAEG